MQQRRRFSNLRRPCFRSRRTALRRQKGRPKSSSNVRSESDSCDSKITIVVSRPLDWRQEISSARSNHTAFTCAALATCYLPQFGAESCSARKTGWLKNSGENRNHWVTVATVATVAKVSHKKSAAVACSQQQQRAELLSDDASDCFPEDSCRYQHCSWAFHQIDHLLQQPCSEQLIFQKVSFFRFSLTRRRFNPRAKGGLNARFYEATGLFHQRKAIETSPADRRSWLIAFELSVFDCETAGCEKMPHVSKAQWVAYPRCPRIGVSDHLHFCYSDK